MSGLAFTPEENEGLRALVTQARDFVGTPYTLDVCEAIVAWHERRVLTWYQRRLETATLDRRLRYAALIELLRQTDPGRVQTEAAMRVQEAAGIAEPDVGDPIERQRTVCDVTPKTRRGARASVPRQTETRRPIRAAVHLRAGRPAVRLVMNVLRRLPRIMSPVHYAVDEDAFYAKVSEVYDLVKSRSPYVDDALRSFEDWWQRRPADRAARLLRPHARERRERNRELIELLRSTDAGRFRNETEPLAA